MRNFATCGNPKTHKDVIVQQHNSLVAALHLNRYITTLNVLTVMDAKQD